MSVLLPVPRNRARARTDGSVGTPQLVSTSQADQRSSTRGRFEVKRGKFMEYQLMLPAGHDPAVPIPFLLSVSGTAQQHVNGFSQRLLSDSWAVVVAIRPDDAPLMFDGTGKEGDGPWYLYQLCQHLLQRFAVDTERFLLAGVSNGGMSVLRFATLWPELCRGVIVATGHLSGIAADKELARLQGVPIDMYVGSLDELGMCPPMRQLELKLTNMGQKPLPQLTVFEGVGHMCSPCIDTRVLFGKIRMMLAHSAGSRVVSIKVESIRDNLNKLSSEQVHAELLHFSRRLGLQLRDEAEESTTSDLSGTKRPSQGITFLPSALSDESESDDDDNVCFQRTSGAAAGAAVVPSIHVRVARNANGQTPCIPALQRDRAARDVSVTRPTAQRTRSPSIHHTSRVHSPAQFPNLLRADARGQTSSSPIKASVSPVSPLVLCRDARGQTSISPIEASVSPVVPLVLRRAPCQTSISPRAQTSLSPAPKATRQQRGLQIMHCGAGVRAVSPRLECSKYVVVR